MFVRLEDGKVVAKPLCKTCCKAFNGRRRPCDFHPIDPADNMPLEDEAKIADIQFAPYAGTIVMRGQLAADGAAGAVAGKDREAKSTDKSSVPEATAPRAVSLA